MTPLFANQYENKKDLRFAGFTHVIPSREVFGHSDNNQENPLDFNYTLQQHLLPKEISTNDLG